MQRNGQQKAPQMRGFLLERTSDINTGGKSCLSLRLLRLLLIRLAGLGTLFFLVAENAFRGTDLEDRTFLATNGNGNGANRHDGNPGG